MDTDTDEISMGTHNGVSGVKRGTRITIIIKHGLALGYVYFSFLNPSEAYLHASKG